MKKITPIRPRRSKNTKDSTQWKLHQLIGKFAIELDILPDAAAIRGRPTYSAPRPFLTVVF